MAATHQKGLTQRQKTEIQKCKARRESGNSSASAIIGGRTTTRYRTRGTKLNMNLNKYIKVLPPPPAPTSARPYVYAPWHRAAQTYQNASVPDSNGTQTPIDIISPKTTTVPTACQNLQSDRPHYLTDIVSPGRRLHPRHVTRTTSPPTACHHDHHFTNDMLNTLKRPTKPHTSAKCNAIDTTVCTILPTAKQGRPTATRHAI